MIAGILGDCQIGHHPLNGASVIRRAFILAATLFAITACAAKVPDTTADVAKLKDIETQWYDHYNKGDAAGVANLYAEDGIVLAAGSPAAVGREAIKAFLVGDIAATKASGLTDHQGDFTGAGVSGDLAWVSGTYSLANAAGETVDHGKYTSVFQRANGEWKIIRDTWNSDAAPPAAPAPVASPAVAAPGKK